MSKASLPAATPVRPSTSSASTSARRSVWGCLTCRRRKVKCQSRETPCAACRRLQLDCVSSFGENFKQWRRRRASPADGPGPSPRPRPSPSPRPRPSQTPVFESPATTLEAPSPVSLHALLDMTQSPGWDLDMPFLFDPPSFAGPPPPLPPGPPPPAFAVASPGLYASAPFFADSSDVLPMDGRAILPGISIPSTLSMTAVDDNGFILDMPAPLHSFQTAPSQPAAADWTQSQHALSHARPQSAVLVSPLSPSPFLSAFSPLPSYADSPADRSLVVYYKRNLASFFSVKSAFASPAASPWNFYAYAIRAAEHQPDSPLRHAILAWTSAYLLVRGGDNDSDDGNRNNSTTPALGTDHALQVRHYARARQAADALRAALWSGAGPYATPTSTLRMLLATTLFLAYGDILSGDTPRLVHALAGIARLLASDWPRFRAAIGPVEARILVWLAYLDVRAGLWGVATDGAGGGRGGGGGGLFRFLRDHVGGPASSGISALRGNGVPQEYYLAACFGSALPAHELHDDLLQEPAKRLSDEIMGVFAAVGELEAWMETCFPRACFPHAQTPSRGTCAEGATTADAAVDVEAATTPGDTLNPSTHAMASLVDHDQAALLELRAAKIHALRATIARIRAESNVVHAALLKAYTPSSPDHVARTTFHRRVSTAMCLAATILLNRVDAPDVRTDDEAQAAARQIVQIARELKYNETPDRASREERHTAQGRPDVLRQSPSDHPRSLIWPMPVFVAGIEVTDPVYQDWVLAYLADMAGWGTSTRRARELLRRVLARQADEGKRVRVKDVVGEFGAVLI
ncbi:hypothetical protein SPBR_02396 [Sporothrix brasiliensis 5110]|uniref:Zn(2)-C6 fungal-type domain-containing protein n=1 Tax=Sporothrix brasiliensis 5110 TaxID=1398154 RepID=A0A0C2J841_9PEZI|nr:uncharacterized protein SPBR_02396 [Sporothrix brasiliensis 5110]KIH93162.1 hypothetical protein SPBR_02396 [Sporothrix brasiliensis 5110]